MTLIPKNFKSRSTVNLGLHLGAITGNIGWVKYALDNGQPIDSVINGLLPIHVACSGGNIQVVEYLLERGSDINARRRSRRLSGSLLIPRSEDVGLTPLHYAAANGSVELVELLVNKGAIIDSVDKYGSSPLSIALAKGNFAVAMLLQQYLYVANAKKQASILSTPMKNSHSTFSLEGDNKVLDTTISSPKVDDIPKVRTRRSSLPDVLFSNKTAGDKVRSFKNLFRKNSKDLPNDISSHSLHLTDALVSTHCLQTIVSPMSTPS